MEITRSIVDWRVDIRVCKQANPSKIHQFLTETYWWIDYWVDLDEMNLKNQLRLELD
jgi:hypothetical protein